MSDLTVEKRERFFATPEEYLAFEEEADEKHEWWDGEVIAMPGNSKEHVTINANVIGELHTRLKGTPCGVVTSDLRVRTPTFRSHRGQRGLYTYPDATVFCGEAELDHEVKGSDTLKNPKLLIEILSPSTESNDRGGKFERYQTIESFREYVLVSQSEPHIQVFLRQDDGAWKISWYRGLDAVARFDSINVDLPLVDVYDRIEFEDEA
jgi:Uma2 family endonuclease